MRLQRRRLTVANLAPFLFDFSFRAIRVRIAHTAKQHSRVMVSERRTTTVRLPFDAGSSRWESQGSVGPWRRAHLAGVDDRASDYRRAVEPQSLPADSGAYVDGAATADAHTRPRSGNCREPGCWPGAYSIDARLFGRRGSSSGP